MIFLCGCSGSTINSQHIGTWEADILNEFMLVWTLDETTITFATSGNTETGSYAIDYTQVPISLDVVIDGEKTRCIIEFIGDDTFRITGEDDEGEPRPVMFEGAEDILIFNRVKENASPVPEADYSSVASRSFNELDLSQKDKEIKIPEAIIHELFRAVETKDLEVIYRYAAPEIKRKISYTLFMQHLWPNITTKDIKVLSTDNYITEGHDSEYILLVLSFEEGGIQKLSAMRWEKTAESIHYDTFPFHVTRLGEFSLFPSHMTN